MLAIVPLFTPIKINFAEPPCNMRLSFINLLLGCTICLLLATRPADAKGRGSGSGRGSITRSFSVPKTSYKKLAVVPAVVPTYHYATTRNHGHRNDEENNCTFYQKYFLGRTNCKKSM
jgi:hypothetical protein